MYQSTRVQESAGQTKCYGVLGAHGGAGTSTVTRWLDPDGSGGSLELSTGSHLPSHYIPLVVARSTAFGMQEAVRLIGRWHPTVPRPYLVIVRDAPLRLPRAVVYRRRAIGSRVLGIAEVPYLVRLREIDTPAEGLTHPAVQKAARNLRRQLGLPS